MYILTDVVFGCVVVVLRAHLQLATGVKSTKKKIYLLFSDDDDDDDKVDDVNDDDDDGKHERMFFLFVSKEHPPNNKVQALEKWVAEFRVLFCL